MQAIEKVAKTDDEGTTYIGRKALRDEMMPTKDKDGMTGTLTCDKHGECGRTTSPSRNTPPATRDLQSGKNPKSVYSAASGTRARPQRAENPLPRADSFCLFIASAGRALMVNSPRSSIPEEGRDAPLESQC